jgi:branched-chain amino acid transport system substrate-binding protein
VHGCRPQRGCQHPAAFAQAKEQFFPLLVYRTGAYAPNGTPFGQRHAGLPEATSTPRAASTASRPLYEECETGYATDKGVECYERLKGKNGGTVFQPLSTGITFALTDKAPATRSR